MSDAGLRAFDPLRFHYIETLQRHVNEQQGEVRRLLEQRLNAELAALQESFAHSQTAVGVPVKSRAPSALGELLGYLTEHAPAPDANRHAERPELNSITAFRSTWSKLSAGRQLTQAIDQAPENAGPLNSHMLVLRSLATMRDVSPDYLERFMSYVDTLLSLEQNDARSRPQPKHPARRAPASKSARR